MCRKIFTTIILISVGLIIAACTKNEEAPPKAELFGKLSDGQEIYKYTLVNANGMTADIINYGAIVTSLKVPGRDGNVEDVIFGFDNLEDYEKDNSFQGAIVGRYGNRIAAGKFSLDGKDYQLSVNSGENHLHGGFKGFYKAVWKSEQLKPHSLRLELESPDGDEGYPGNIKVIVTYTISPNNELLIEYSGTTDAPTILNPTNHCYFNLTGNPENSILDHELTIDADKFTPVDNKLIPTGELQDVTGTPMDFRTPAVIGNKIGEKFEQLDLGYGFDHNWVLNNYSKEVRIVASLYEPESGRKMDILTDQPGLQFYSGNFLDGTMKGKGGKSYAYRTALCLETQAFPDTPNKPEFPSVVLRPGEAYTHTAIYRFSTK
jgi:aldose 1-epimerase